MVTVQLESTEAAHPEYVPHESSKSIPDPESITLPAFIDEPERWLSEQDVLTALDRHEIGDAELMVALYEGRVAFDNS
jgi:hypothetical protein